MQDSRSQKEFGGLTNGVLILEDEVLLARNIAQYLEKKGFPAQTAPTAAEALRKLRKKPFRILLVDIDLPDCDGLDFYRVIRPLYPHMHVVAMSGRTSSKQHEIAHELGVQTYLTKPFSLAYLAEIFQQTLEPGQNIAGAE